jgi:hypothetical protein
VIALPLETAGSQGNPFPISASPCVSVTRRWLCRRIASASHRPPPRVQSLFAPCTSSAAPACFLFYRTRSSDLGPVARANSAKKMAAAAEEAKVFVALPVEFKAGQSTLWWALSQFGGGGSTIVITHVHVPSQMIPVSTCSLYALIDLNPFFFWKVLLQGTILPRRVCGNQPSCDLMNWDLLILVSFSCGLLNLFGI